MKASRLGGCVAMAAMLAACQGSIHVGSGAGSPATGGGNEAAAKPAPAPAPLPKAVPPTTPNATTPPAPPPAPAAGGAHQIGRLSRLALRQTPPPAATNAAGTSLSAGAITRIRQRTPAGCGPQEVAPNVIIHVDCVQRYTAPSKARVVSPLRRLNLFRKGKLTTDADSVGGGVPKGSGGGGGNVGDTPLPDTVDHRKDGTEGPVKDQGVVGSCTGFSLSTTVDNAIRRLNKADVASSMHIWSHYAYPNMTNAGDSNLNRPLAVWPDWTYDQKLACRMYSGPNQFSCGEEFDPAVQQNSTASDPAVQQQIKDADAKGKWKITNITNILGDDPPNPDALAAVLATGKDIWAAFTINMTAWGMRGASSGEISDWSQGGGGHAVVIAGYRVKNGSRQFLIHNSWTERWGGPEKGYAWINESMVKQWLHGAYTIALQDMSAPPPPPPPPGPKPDGTCQTGFTKIPNDSACYKVCKQDSECGSGQACGSVSSSLSICADANPLTDDDCADDELVDSVTKKCAPMCSDDSRPANGKCPAGATGGGVPRR